MVRDIVVVGEERKVPGPGFIFVVVCCSYCRRPSLELQAPSTNVLRVHLLCLFCCRGLVGRGAVFEVDGAASPQCFGSLPASRRGEARAELARDDAPLLVLVVVQSRAKLVVLPWLALLLMHAGLIMSDRRPFLVLQQCGSLGWDASLTISSFHSFVLALSLVQYRTCNVPDDRPGKKSAICFHVRFFCSFSSMSS